MVRCTQTKKGIEQTLTLVTAAASHYPRGLASVLSLVLQLRTTWLSGENRQRPFRNTMRNAIGLMAGMIRPISGRRYEVLLYIQLQAANLLPRYPFLTPFLLMSLYILSPAIVQRPPPFSFLLTMIRQEVDKCSNKVSIHCHYDHEHRQPRTRSRHSCYSSMWCPRDCGRLPPFCSTMEESSFVRRRRLVDGCKFDPVVWNASGWLHQYAPPFINLYYADGSSDYKRKGWPAC